MKIQLLTSLLLVSATLLSAVPSEINYQGRLTDANGDAVTGDVTMSLKMYDAATGGNEIYSEDIGTVTLDSNGIYSFEFGAGGQSVIDRTDTIAVADGSATTYTGSVSSTPLSGTLSVSDGTYSWNIMDGNPGQQATATAQLVNGFVIGVTVTNGGEGYSEAPVVIIDGNGTAATATAVVENGVLTAINADTAGSGYTNATVNIAAPPAPYVVDYSAETVTVTYESAPTAGTEIVASYEANDSSIVGALSAVDAHWLELSVDGTAQSPRERILSVPFAQVAGVANDYTNDFGDYSLRQNGVVYDEENAGFVLGITPDSENVTCSVMMGDVRTSLEIVASIQTANVGHGVPGASKQSCLVPIPRNTYWQSSGFSTVNFIPLK